MAGQGNRSGRRVVFIRCFFFPYAVIPGTNEIVADAFERPEYYIAMAVCLTVFVFVKHKPLRPFSGGGKLMGINLQKNIPGQLVFLRGQEKFKGSLADIPCSPCGSSRLFQAVGGGKVGEGIVGIPFGNGIQLFQFLFLRAVFFQEKAAKRLVIVCSA